MKNTKTSIQKFRQAWGGGIIALAVACFLFWAVMKIFEGCDKTAPYPGPTPAQIKQEVKEAVQPADHKIDSLEKERKELVKVAKTLNEKLLLAQYENKRLRCVAKEKNRLRKIEEPSNYDYNIGEIYFTPVQVEEITTAAAYSDSVSNEVIANLQDQLINSDSISFQKDIKIATYKTGFEKMGEVAERAQYDLGIANKKLKRKTFWGKVKNGVIVGFLIKTGIDILKK